MMDSGSTERFGRLKLILRKTGGFVVKYQYWIVALIVLASLAARLVYVFGMTQIHAYLYSDMGAYWQMAEERLQGNEVNIGQWIIWPPFYHISLSYAMRVIDFLGLTAFRLEIIKTGDILLGAASIFFLFGIAKKIAKGNPVPGLLSAAAYALCYPMIYLNAFVLSENLAIPLLVFSIWCVFRVSTRSEREAAVVTAARPRPRFLSIPLVDFLWITLSALALAIATAARPAFGLLGLLFGLFLAGLAVFRIRAIVREKDARREALGGIAKAAVFSIVFFAFIGLVMMENSRISEGKLTGLGAGGGFNFYLAQSKKYWLETNFGGYRFILVPPGTVDQPERGKLITDVPFYDQAYFYDLGWRYLKDHPQMIVKNLLSFETLFFGPLFPSDPSARWFVQIIPIFKWALFLMAASILVLLPFMLKDPRLRSRYFYFLLVLPLFLLSLNLVYNVEQRYLYSFAFILCVLFVFAAFSFFRAKGRHLLFRAAYFALMIVLVLVAPPLVREIRARSLPNTVRATLTQCDGHIPSFDFWDPPPKGPVATHSITAAFNSVRFRAPGPLRHEDKGNVGRFDDYFFGVFETSFRVLESGTYSIEVFADESARLVVDGVLMGEATWNQEDGYGTIDFAMHMEKDTDHTVVIEYIEQDGDLALISAYRKVGDDGEDFFYLGQNSKYFRFEELPR